MEILARSIAFAHMPLAAYTSVWPDGPGLTGCLFSKAYAAIANTTILTIFSSNYILVNGSLGVSDRL